MTPPVHFTKLIQRATRANRGPTEPPLPMRDVADALGVSRAYIYALLAGHHRARAHTQALMARGLARLTGLKLATVESRLAEDWGLI